MINHWAKLCFMGFVCATVALANHDTAKQPAMSGSFEGGFGYSVTPGATNGTQWLVDGLHLKNTFDVSDKTKVILHNAFGLNSENNGAPGGVNNGSAYFSNYTLAVAVGGGTFAFSNLAAYIQHECAKGFWTSVGHMPVPFGMENMWDRYDMHSYYYSPGYTTAQSYGWNYDLGLKLMFSDLLPGTLEVALLDGRQPRLVAPFSKSNALGIAARWHHELKGGDWSFTPVVSTLMEKWNGGPNDLGITAGGMFKMGALWANAEWFYTSVGPTGGKTKAWQITAEPGFDLGVADVSVKYDLTNVTVGAGAATTDHTIAAAISKTYEEKYRIKLAYQHQNLSGKNGPHVNDIRLLFATKW